jgi:hypothetical protein
MDSSTPVVGHPLLPVVLDLAINEFRTSTLIVFMDWRLALLDWIG